MDAGAIISLVCTIVCCIICVITYFTNKKDKSNKETENNSFNQGQLVEKVSNLDNKIGEVSAQVKEILDKVTEYPKELKKEIQDVANSTVSNAILKHELKYHKGETK